MPDTNGQVTEESTKAKIDTSTARLSMQQRALEREQQILSYPSTFWISSHSGEEEIAEWWTPERDRDLRKFWMRRNNDILQGAISSMIKKFTAMNWVIEGPMRVVNRYQRLLLASEFWKGWGVLLSKTLTEYLTQDKGVFWELLGAGNINGQLEGPVLGIAHLDSQFCQLTGDIEYPVIFHNAKTGKPHKLHVSRVVHMVDMPSPNENMNGVGFCAVSRVIGSSEILLKINKYKNEKLDDLPQAGLLLLNNILPEKWNDASADYQRERRRMGQDIWTNIMVHFGLDPAQPATADFVSFAGLPEAFNELESTNIYINILALAFGVDVREFWPITGGALGTATESEVMHQKARGKGVGDIISTLERALNWHVLPPSATFRFDFKDDEEDLLSAEIADKRTSTIMSMWQPGDEITPTPVSALEIRQMLADNVPYFKEAFLEVDITPEGEASDTELDKRFGPIIQIDRKGYTRRLDKRRLSRPVFQSAVDLAKQNYEDGAITAEQVAEFALGELINAG